MLRHLSIIAFILILAISMPSFAQQIKVGEPYPEFVLPEINYGHPFSPGCLRGKPTVLIHFASW